MSTYEEHCEEREWLRDEYSDVDSMLLLNDVIQSFDRLQSSGDIDSFKSEFDFSSIEQSSNELQDLKIEPDARSFVAELKGHRFAVLKHRSYERGAGPFSVGWEVDEVSLHVFTHDGSALISHEKSFRQ